MFAFVACMLLLIVQSSHGSEIIGGKEVKKHSLPYMALLMRDKNICGGILIDPSWVLTAAHCEDLRIKQVCLGVHSIRNRKEESWQVINVKSFPHPRYDKADKLNDLMLLKLATPAKETEMVKPLLLGNTVKDPAAKTKCLVAGWGKTDKKSTSDVLMSANVTVIDRVKCKKCYKPKPVITKSMICAGLDGKKKTDTCQGDSGGPLLCNDVLVGVTSFGKKCAMAKYPGVYSFLSEEQLSWIKQTMNAPKI